MHIYWCILKGMSKILITFQMIENCFAEWFVIVKCKKDSRQLLYILVLC